MAEIKQYRKRLDSSKSVRQFLADIMHELKEDQITESKARTLAYVSSIMLQAIDRSSIEERIDELEKQIEKKVI